MQFFLIEIVNFFSNWLECFLFELSVFQVDVDRVASVMITDSTVELFRAPSSFVVLLLLGNRPRSISWWNILLVSVVSEFQL